MTDDTQNTFDADRDKQIDELKNFIATAETNLEEAKKSLAALTGESFVSAKPSKVAFSGDGANGKVVEGIYNGENMLDMDGKTYPVPANYASKSKLIEGDRLKLTIAEDGSFIFKQIGPAERKKIIGTLNFENNVYTVSAEGKSYNVLYASVTYFKAKAGDRITIIVPAKEDSKWAAIENIIHDTPEEEVPKEEILDLGEDVHSSFLDSEPPAVDGIAPAEAAEGLRPQLNSVPTVEEPMDRPQEPQNLPPVDLPEFPSFEPTESPSVSENKVEGSLAGVPSPDDVFAAPAAAAPLTPEPQSAPVNEAPAPAAQPAKRPDELEI